MDGVPRYISLKKKTSKTNLKESSVPLDYHMLECNKKYLYTWETRNIKG